MRYNTRMLSHSPERKMLMKIIDFASALLSAMVVGLGGMLAIVGLVELLKASF